jgi:SPP1 family predicted phage head-tail adaptor
MRFRHRIRLQRRSLVKDALGQQTPDWIDIGPPLWADVVPLSGRELLAGQAIHVEVNHTIAIRYQRQFGNPREMAAMRILYGRSWDRIFNIHASIDPEERHQTLEFSCSEGLNDG